MSGVHELAPIVGLVAACAALAVSRATLYRRQVYTCAPPRPPPARALNAAERQAVLHVANSDRFVDAAPAEIVNTLLEEGVYLCATRTMYRVLAAEGEVRERRDQLRHPEYKKPQLLATGPNQVWSWDITKLLCVEKWRYLYLYVIIDVFSRAVVGWLLAEHENAEYAKRLIRETCRVQGVEEEQLTIHSDRGAPMTSKTMAQLLADLVVTQSHSRPHVSNDNPFSESQFKTLKYRPDFPDRFDGLRDGIEHCRRFFDWYNNQHKHSGIAFCTPSDVHTGRAEEVLAKRQTALDAAYAAYPERFVHGPPRVAQVPNEVWINPPEKAEEMTGKPAVEMPGVAEAGAGQSLPVISQVGLRSQGELHVEHMSPLDVQPDLLSDIAMSTQAALQSTSSGAPERPGPKASASRGRVSGGDGDNPPSLGAPGPAGRAMSERGSSEPADASTSEPAKAQAPRGLGAVQVRARGGAGWTEAPSSPFAISVAIDRAFVPVEHPRCDDVQPRLHDLDAHPRPVRKVEVL